MLFFSFVFGAVAGCGVQAEKFRRQAIVFTRILRLSVFDIFVGVMDVKIISETLTTWPSNLPEPSPDDITRF